MSEETYRQKLEGRISSLSRQMREGIEIYTSGEPNAPNRPTSSSSEMVIAGLVRSTELLALIGHYDACFPKERARYALFRKRLEHKQQKSRALAIKAIALAGE